MANFLVSEFFAILNAYKQIPKSEPWLRRLFREQHPEIFSQEAIGKAKLRRVYDRLASHPDVLPEFEAWVKTIWATYEEMLKHTIRPLSSYFHSERKVPAHCFERTRDEAANRATVVESMS